VRFERHGRHPIAGDAWYVRESDARRKQSAPFAKCERWHDGRCHRERECDGSIVTGCNRNAVCGTEPDCEADFHADRRTVAGAHAFALTDPERLHALGRDDVHGVR
jgi:hypothetical protein